MMTKSPKKPQMNDFKNESTSSKSRLISTINQGYRKFLPTDYQEEAIKSEMNVAAKKSKGKTTMNTWETLIFIINSNV